MIGQLDAKVVVAARSGDQAALEELVAHYLPLVYSIVGRALDRPADVDDVVQDTMVRLVDGLPGVRDPRSFRSWLVAVTLNQIRGRYQSRHSGPARWDELSDLADPGADFEDLTLTRLGLSGQRKEVAQATGWLDPDDRHLLSLWWLVETGHLSRAELVESLDTKPHTVTVRVARMKGQLDTARLVVRALARRPCCPELLDLVAGWNGRPNSVWRKRLARHIRTCEICPDPATAGLIPAERLLAGLALTPLPAGLAARVAESTHVSAAAAAPTRIPGPRAAGQRASHRAKRPAARYLLSKTAVTAVAGAAVIATGYAVTRGPAPKASTINQASKITIPATSPQDEQTTRAAQTNPSTPAASSPSPTAAHPASPTTHPATSAPVASSPAGSAGATDTEATAVELKVLDLMNQERAENGLPPYTMTPALMKSAGAHNTLMASGCGMLHQCPGEPLLGAREIAAGVHETACGENISWFGAIPDTESAETQTADNMNTSMYNEQPPDDGHRLNILSSTFKHVGIVVFRNSTTGILWMTQDFSN